MALLFELAAGSGLGAVAGEAMKIGMDATERIFNYTAGVQNFKTTLSHISECVEKIKALNNRLGLGHELMEVLQTILEAGDETVSKCREDDNFLKRLTQSGEITDLDNALQNFLSKIMPLYQFMETKEIRHHIQEMGKIIQTHEKKVANRVLMDFMKDFWYDLTLKARFISSLLTRKLCYKIFCIMARALNSYHDDGSENIHGNINSYNVILNRDFDGCIITNDNGSYPLIYNNRGSGDKFINVPGMKPNSIGYHAPEVIETGRATQKSDVYSFGVIQLEILTGENPSLCDLPKKVRSMILNGNECEVFDEKLLQGPTRDEDMLEMRQMLEIAMQCVAEDPNERPNMGDVVRMIENIRTIT